MYRWLNNRKGQNTAEYAILIGVIVAAAIAMQIYIRRGMQARIKDAVDYTMTAGASKEEGGTDLFNQSQYEPYYMSSDFNTTQSGATTEAMESGGGLTRNVISQTTLRTGNQVYGNYAVENGS